MFSKGSPACLFCPAMPSKQSCPRVNADQRGSLGGEPIKFPTSLVGSICPTSRVQMIGYSVGLCFQAGGLWRCWRTWRRTVTIRFPWWLLCWGQGLDSFSATKPVFTLQCLSVHPSTGSSRRLVPRSPRSLESRIPCREPWPRWMIWLFSLSWARCCGRVLRHFSSCHVHNHDVS